ncbi:hypothetical protein MMC30_005228 [Trapelia coarctata]|nr:hypothetical protein [Trapelia coarctata]
MKPSRALFSLLTLETERKFACTLQTIPLLNKNAGSPPIRNLFFEGQKTFKDIYYDFPNPSPPATSLSSLGIWIRQRNGDWQAKVRQGGDYTNTQSAELKGESDIHAHLLTLPIPFPPPNSTPGLLGLGLHKTACFSTTRHSWRADEKGIFKIVVDETDFGHIVGEVEVELLVEQEEVDVVEFSRGVNEWIERFMERYPWAFPEEEAVGKLSAWFAMMKKENPPGGWNK